VIGEADIRVLHAQPNNIYTYSIISLTHSLWTEICVKFYINILKSVVYIFLVQLYSNDNFTQ
jgi:hypothetical protein